VSFATLIQGSTGAAVADVQRRLADLGLLSSSPDVSIYRDSQWTLWEIQQQRGPSPDTGGYYGQATDDAIMAFKRHFLDNDQGPVPPGSCDAATYAKLHSETASYTG
jgi:peptidoglycan hydrolase-like protein with peptidoglycan-binding domain